MPVFILLNIAIFRRLDSLSKWKAIFRMLKIALYSLK